MGDIRWVEKSDVHDDGRLESLRSRRKLHSCSSFNQSMWSKMFLELMDSAFSDATPKVDA